jgi:hypothetical protein
MLPMDTLLTWPPRMKVIMKRHLATNENDTKWVLDSSA